MFFKLSLSKTAFCFIKLGLSESSIPANTVFISCSLSPTTIISPKSKFSISSTSSIFKSIFSISDIFSSSIKILILRSSPSCKISVLLFLRIFISFSIPKFSLFPNSSFISISSISPKLRFTLLYFTAPISCTSSTISISS